MQTPFGGKTNFKNSKRALLNVYYEKVKSDYYTTIKILNPIGFSKQTSFCGIRQLQGFKNAAHRDIFWKCEIRLLNNKLGEKRLAVRLALDPEGRL